MKSKHLILMLLTAAFLVFKGDSCVTEETDIEVPVIGDTEFG